MTTTCAACGHEHREGRKFCTNCGAPLSRTCPACGGGVEPGERFCGECGAQLTSPAPASTAAPIGAREEPATPDHLAEKILDARPQLEGERKQVTVLFADVQGSMELQEDLDPEKWAGIMDRFFQVLSDSVHRFEGTVDKFTGDGIMALFGAPVAHEDHARRACHAALHLAGAVGAYAGELRTTRGLNFHVRVGLNSGEVVVGRIGDDARMEYTALGHTVGLAQRMEALAEPGNVYLTEDTARLVSGAFRLRDLGRLPVKGSREPVGVFVLEGTGPRRRGVTRWPGRSPLVGRDEEMAALEGALARALDGQAQVVGVVGEAGVGKSRLCEEFVRTCASRGIIVRRAAGLSHATAIPLLPVLDLLRDYFGITDTDSPRQAREKVAGRLLLLDPTLQEALPVLFDFLEVPDPDRPPPRLAAEVRMQRVFDILRRVVQRRSEREPLVLLLEDLHWFDPHSEAFLNEHIPSYPGTRTLVLANFRPGFSAPWMSHSYYRQLPLQPLPAEAVAELLGALLGPDPSLTPLRENVMGRTGGNPFFIEEVVRALVEDGTLSGEAGAYRLTRPLTEVRVPPTVQAVLAARIDRLPERDKQILQTAAVIGRTFPEAVLQAVAGSTSGHLGATLRALSAAEFLQEEAAPPTTEYRFWHPLTQEVAYGTLLAERRARLHAGVARALADLDPDRQDERAALIATHFEAAGDHLESARWNARAATWALRGSMDESIRRWRGTMAHLDAVVETEETLALGVRARYYLLRLGSRRGIDTAEAEALFAEGRALAERLVDPGPLGLINAMWGTVQFFGGDIRAGRDFYLEGRRLVAASADLDARVPPAMAVALVCLYTGTIDEGLSIAEDATALCEGEVGRGMRTLGYSALLRNLVTRGELLVLGGRVEAGREEIHRALALAREHQQAELLAWALPAVADAALLAGDGESGLKEADEARRIAEDTGNLVTAVMALRAIGIAHLSDGQAVDALAILTQALGVVRDQGAGGSEEATVLIPLARAHLDTGDATAARRFAGEAVDVARRQGARILECAALLTRAHVLRKTGAPDSAVHADLAAALALVEETGAVSYEPFIGEEQARLEGDKDQLRKAAGGYAAIGAAGHARRLEAELAGDSALEPGSAYSP